MYACLVFLNNLRLLFFHWLSFLTLLRVRGSSAGPEVAAAAVPVADIVSAPVAMVVSSAAAAVPVADIVSAPVATVVSSAAAVEDNVYSVVGSVDVWLSVVSDADSSSLKSEQEVGEVDIVTTVTW